MHLPWSENLQNDDRMIESLDAFIGQEIVVTEKYDGENTSIYSDYIHSRSPSPMVNHPSRNRVKQLYEQIRHDIPQGWRLCGENCYAKHSIHYTNLPGYFLLFGLWEHNTCKSWDETKEWAMLLGIPIVRELWRGIYDPICIKQCLGALEDHEAEGYVVRVTKSFELSDFPKVVAKYVRKNHVRTSKHWLTEKIIPNELI